MTLHHPDDARNSADIDPLTELGEPFASYGRALLEANDAWQALHVATMQGDRDGINRATLDHEEAVTRVYQIKQHEATAFLMRLRWAEELHPGHVAAALGLSETASDIGELAAAVAELQAPPTRRAA